ncbi:MAG TPA: phosphodiester glycosidase family protein [Gaiellaceae bacterium]|nr:phosphodiester glycosidase family protein [Gaiellaceae bacterium]
MPRRIALVCLLTAVFAAPAHAAPPATLMPGVTYEKTVEFTPHGAVVLNVITAPPPGGLYQVGPALARSSILGGKEKLTEIEKDVSATATVAGIDGDVFSPTDAHPSGLVMSGGVLQHPPFASRSSIGFDAAGGLHVDRVRFQATWRGTGQRRALAGLNQTAAGGQYALFTPAWGARVPTVANSAEIVFQSYPAATPNTDLTATVSATSVGGGETVPPNGAVLQATGVAAAKLQAEAPVGATITTRYILQPAWTGMVAGIGGGPALVKNGKPVFRALEDFTNDQIAGRLPRAGVGQLADGRVILVAIDGDQPGYSVGLTNYELAQTMVQLGAVTASALASGAPVAAAFDGQLLSHPSKGESAIKDALLVQYFGVYAAPPALPLLTGEPNKAAEPLSYKIVRPSKVTAELIAPDTTTRVLESGVQHDPGSYPFTFASYDAEGTWHWNVTATDNQGLTSTIDRPFRYDTTLRDLAVPRTAKSTLTVGFTLSRPARVELRVETSTGVVVRDLAPVSLQAGTQSVGWDGKLPKGSPAFSGPYLAHLFYTSSVGTSDQTVSFIFRR